MRASRQFIAAVIALFALVNARAQVPPAPHVYTAEIDGIIHPVAAEYVREVIAKADADGAALVVISLRTPGGLVDSTRDINNAIIHAKTPVAVFVGPSGNRAASAGFLITIAADIAAQSCASMNSATASISAAPTIPGRTTIPAG